MANNQYVNKVVFGDQTLIDLTSDTITPGVFLQGFTAHDKGGAPITGIIPDRNGLDLIPDYTIYEVGGTDHHFSLTVPAGYYRYGARIFEKIQVPVPESGTNSITIEVPNGTSNPDPTDSSDWLPITFSVDVNGNSNITDNTIPASGVSF